MYYKEGKNNKDKMNKIVQWFLTWDPQKDFLASTDQQMDWLDKQDISTIWILFMALFLMKAHIRSQVRNGLHGQIRLRTTETA